MYCSLKNPFQECSLKLIWFDYGPFHCHAINHSVTSQIIHSPHETFLAAVYFLFFHCVTFNVAFLSWNLDTRQKKTISCCLFYIVIRSRNQLLHFSFRWLSRHEISISTGHGVFFICLQDMYQIKGVEPFQRYHLFCGIWQRKSISCCLIYIAIASLNQSFHDFLVTKCRHETKEDHFILRLRHTASPFETSSIISLSWLGHVAKILTKISM